MNPFSVWLDAMRFAADSQQVIAHRLLRLAANDANSHAEATRMVSEKIVAMMDSQAAIVRATLGGHRPHVVAERAMAPYKRRVRANLSRLRG